jgi:hypothetical protein
MNYIKIVMTGWMLAAGTMVAVQAAGPVREERLATDYAWSLMRAAAYPLDLVSDATDVEHPDLLDVEVEILRREGGGVHCWWRVVDGPWVQAACRSLEELYARCDGPERLRIWLVVSEPDRSLRRVSGPHRVRIAWER